MMCEAFAPCVSIKYAVRVELDTTVLRYVNLLCRWTGKEEEESHSKRASVEGLRSGSAIELVGKETPVRGGRASDAAANPEPESARGCSQEIFPALSACLWSPAMPPAAP